MVSSDSSLLYIALSLLYSTNRNGLVPETCFFMAPDQIITMVKSFGGQTVYIPTAEEFYDDLLAALLVYYTYVEGREEDWFKAKYEVDGRKLAAIGKRTKSWIDKLDPSERDLLNLMRETIKRETDNVN